MQRQVEERGISGLGVFLQRVEAGVGRVGEILFPRGDDAHEPALAQPRVAVRSRGEKLEHVREEDGDGLLGRPAGKGGGDVVAPELEAEGADVGRGDGVGDAGDFEVEGADGEVGQLGGRGDEGQEGVGGGVIFSDMEGLVLDENECLVDWSEDCT